MDSAWPGACRSAPRMAPARAGTGRGPCRPPRRPRGGGEPRSSIERRRAGRRHNFVMVRQAKLGRGGSDVGQGAETSRWCPAGESPDRPRAASQPEASLACSGEATRPMKRRQRARGPCDRAPTCVAGAERLVTLEGNIVTRSRPRVTVLPGSKSTARGQGYPRNLGDPIVSIDETGERAADQLSEARERRVPARRERRRTRRWYRGARKPSDPEGTMGSRSACTVPVKRGNLPEGPRGGRAGAGLWSHGRDR